MCHIFELVQEVDENDEEWYWIAVSHVCRSWRGIALGYQELWTYIRTDLHSGFIQTSAYLERSGTSQLVVHHMGETSIFSSLSLVLALNHLSRIRDLQICGQFEFPDKLISFLERPAPVLQCLILDTNSEREIGMSRFLSGHAPMLEHLELFCTTTSWSNISSIHNLKTLILGSPSSVNLEDILLIFTMNPNLEEVEINRISRTAPTSSCFNRGVVNLPFMEVFKVYAAPYAILSHLVDSVLVPADTAWEIFCEDFPFHDPRPKSIIPRSSDGDQDCKYLYLMIRPDAVRIYTDPGTSGNMDLEVRPPTRLLDCLWLGERGLTGIATVPKALDIICGVIKGGFWCSATELEIDIEIDGDPFDDLDTSFRNLETTSWNRLLSLLPLVRRIDVQFVSALAMERPVIFDPFRGLLSSLSTETQMNNGSTRLICPELSELRLNGINLGERHDYVLAAPSFRAEYGNRLHKLEVCNPITPNGYDFEVLRSSQVANAIFISCEVYDPGEDE